MKTIMMLLVPLALVACSVSSRNPVQASSGETPDPAALLGTWELVELVDDSLELGNRVEISEGSHGDLVLTIGSGAEPLTRIALLAETGNLGVLSVQNKDLWYILGLDLDQNGQQLTVHALSLEAVQQAVEAGDLNGDTAEFSFDQQVIQLTDTSADLATFLAANPQIFAMNVATLERASGG